jgi:toxin-antitoxin system PIN domain toxin
MHLLDVNVLIAIVDQGHAAHENAVRWFHSNARHGWATCPITENALVRILSQPAYPNSRKPAVIRDLLTQLKRLPGYSFWPDDLSITQPGILTDWASITPKRLTDAYLLALAVHHHGKLVTLDARIDANCVSSGTDALILISDI